MKVGCLPWSSFSTGNEMGERQITAISIFWGHHGLAGTYGEDLGGLGDTVPTLPRSRSPGRWLSGSPFGCPILISEERYS